MFSKAKKTGYYIRDARVISGGDLISTMRERWHRRPNGDHSVSSIMKAAQTNRMHSAEKNISRQPTENAISKHAAEITSRAKEGSSERICRRRSNSTTLRGVQLARCGPYCTSFRTTTQDQRRKQSACGGPRFLWANSSLACCNPPKPENVAFLKRCQFC